MVCFICPNQEVCSEYVSMYLKVHDIPTTEDEKRKILKVFCELLHVRWGALEDTFKDCVELPLCEMCLNNMMELIWLREELFQIESNMREKIRSIEMTIAVEYEQDSDQDAEELISRSVKRRLMARRHFRRDIMEEHTNKTMLHQKTKEMLEQSENTFAIDPSFVQFSFQFVETGSQKKSCSGNTKSRMKKGKAACLRTDEKLGKGCSYIDRDLKKKMEALELPAFSHGLVSNSDKESSHDDNDVDYVIPRKKSTGIPKSKSKRRKSNFCEAASFPLQRKSTDATPMSSASTHAMKRTYDKTEIEYLAEVEAPEEVEVGSDESSDSSSDAYTPSLPEEYFFKSPHVTTSQDRRSPQKELPTNPLEKVEFRAKDGSTWTTEEPPKGQTKSYNIFREEGAVIGPAANPKLTPEDLFKLMMTPEIVDLVVTYTNDFAAASLEQEQEKGKNSKRWTAVTQEDIYGYMGILIFLGVESDRLLPIDEIWAVEPENPKHAVVATMSRTRFQEITTFLRFSDRMARLTSTTGEVIIHQKFTYISEVFNPFVENIQSLFRPHESLVVAEMFIRLKQNSKIPLPKPKKHGVKLWVVCDSETGYILRIMMYEKGKKSKKVERETQEGKEIVLALVEQYFNTGRSVTMGNFVTSKHLAYELMERDMSMLGTLNPDRLEIIPEFLNTRDREVESSVFAFQKDLTMVSYIQEKNEPILLLSTMHHSTDESDFKRKPKIIHDYNQTKEGMQKAGQMIGNFTCQRVTHRWPLKIFQAMCDIGALNSYLIWTRAQTNEPKRKDERRLFLRQLSESLMEPCIRTRSQLSSSCYLKTHIRIALKTMGYPPRREDREDIEPEAILSTRGSCKMLTMTEQGEKRCRKSSRTRCERCRKFICKSHCRRITACIDCEFTQLVEKQIPPLDPISIEPEVILSTRGSCRILTITALGEKRCKTSSRTRCERCRRFICKSHCRRINACLDCEFTQLVEEKIPPLDPTS